MKNEKGFTPAVRAALYCRVSTEEQAVHGLSIDAQREALDAWAAEHKVRVAGHYVDAGISARKPASKRPELQRLLEDVRAGKIDLIVFTKLDRWFRNIAEYYKVQEVLEQYHVDWKTIHEDYDTSTASGRLKINIMLSVAQDEADRTSERIKAVFAAKRARKEPCTGRMPTGYKLEGKRMVKDPETQEAVACFFENFLISRSIQKARLATQERCGILFSYQIAQGFLRKPVYYGRFQDTDGLCPAYITREQFDDICANRRRNERRAKADRIYLFSGLIFCSECGRRFGSRVCSRVLKSGKISDYISYNCSGRYNMGTCINVVNIRETVIEDFLLQNVDEKLRQYTVELDYLAKSYRPQRNFREERAKLKKKLSRLKDLYVDAIIDLELYRKDYEELVEQLDALAVEERKVSTPPPSSDRLRSIFADGWQDSYVMMSRAEKQAFWRSSIDKIYVYPTRQITISFRP